MKAELFFNQEETMPSAPQMVAYLSILDAGLETPDVSISVKATKRRMS
jgi:hypothetical protein